MSFLFRLFDSAGFPARWSCGPGWSESPWLGWLHILSDLGIWSAYFAIPLVLIYFIVQRKDLPFRRIFVLFGAFILLCGATHLVDAAIFWWPIYRFAGVLKFVTAVVSWGTVVALVQVVPRVLAMRAPEELEREIAARTKAENELQLTNAELEQRVEKRTLELSQAMTELAAERELLHTTLASIGDAVIATDINSKVTFLNSVAEQLTAWTNEEARGVQLETVFNIVNESTRQPVDNPALRALREGVIVGLANHTVLIAKDGTERPIDDSAAPIRDPRGGIAGAVLVFRDITERKEQENELIRAHAELERRVEMRTKELATTNRFQQALLESIQVGIVACDQQGVLTLFNRATREFHGLPLTQIPAEQWADHYDLFQADGASRMAMDQVPLFRALRGENLVDVEMVIAPKQGAPRTLAASGRAFHDDRGELLGAVVAMHDITFRKQAEAELKRINDDLEDRVQRRMADLTTAMAALKQSEEHFRTLADNISQLAWMADSDGALFWYNQRWYDYTGTTPAEMQGWGWQQVHHPDHLDRVVAKYKQAVAEGEQWEDTFPLRSKEGEYRWFLSRAVPIRDETGRVLHWFGTNTDVTEQRKMADELRQLAADLSEADRRKDEFLATLAHELRNPLAPISNGLQVLKIAGSADSTVIQTRTMMERQLGQMVRLVDDLLDVSRITRNKLELRKDRVELATVISSAVETSRPLIESCGHNLTVEMPSEPILLDADLVRLAQVFSNLLNNAAKYTTRGGKIQLHAERRGDEVVVTVTDNGLGIPAAMLPKVFDMFTQVDRTLERAQGGLGIGLTLVRRLVDMHGGTVTALSEGDDRGSVFTVRLPVVDPIAKKAAPAAAIKSASNRPKRKILVADDNVDSATSLSLMLKYMGNEMRMAHDGLQAVAAAEEFRPEVILLDIGMPNLNGYEACRRIREQEWGKKIYLVALTGWGQDEDRQRSKEAGFNYHLVKPVDPGMLEKLLNSLVVNS
ncbi:Autoinducer 2 sensor kinase/phosphatase LuxQ [Anatilimnocola aggregata]|uniref:histidine kinase n=1 Tax=Anatilimnocola aggregata TaxID=2528021 RepID=A0A517YKG3_9BACT|nr:PAS domain S-box protein [Anatilimnocola aggregata]QDU30721.1 Autoinducer 2 sensor kinase/phosphatase LuxQ [Anatilimnocola aggregata]